MQNNRPHIEEELEDIFTGAVFNIVTYTILITPPLMLIRIIIDANIAEEKPNWEYLGNWSGFFSEE